MAITAYLDTPNGAQREGIVMFSVNHLRPRVRISAGMKAAPGQWNQDKARARQNHPQAAHFNRLLADREGQLQSAIMELQAQGKPVTREGLEQRLKWKERGAGSFHELRAAFLESKATTTRATTLKSYGYSFRVVDDFARHQKITLDVHSLDAEFFTDLQHYANTHRGNTNNGFDKTIRQLKTFLRWCFDKGHTTSQAYKLAKRTATKKEINPLEPAELAEMEAAGSFSGLLEDVRRMFLFQCYTGLRFGDMQALSTAHRKANTLRITAGKTSQQLIIPLLPQAAAILKHYDVSAGKVFPRVTNQVFNRYLKEIFCALDMVRPVHQTRQRGREVEAVETRLCDIVTSHDGRRTFITLSLAKGMNAWQLMTITGHENFDNFKKYVRFSSQDVANNFLEAWSK